VPFFASILSGDFRAFLCVRSNCCRHPFADFRAFLRFPSLNYCLRWSILSQKQLLPLLADFRPSLFSPQATAAFSSVNFRPSFCRFP
jgi:hypothetical protein